MALDPQTIATITNVAKNILFRKSEENESGFSPIVIVVAGVSGMFVMVLCMAFYLLTLPHAWLGNMFADQTEYTNVLALREEAKYAALEEPYYQYMDGFVTFGGGVLALPCENFVITSPYGNRPHPFIAGQWQFHTGIDLQPAHHSPIVAVYDGEVVTAKSGFNGGYGNYVEIRHEIGGVIIYSQYAHLSSIKVEVGDEVEQGDIIGLEGGDPDTDPSPGSSTGHHLHFEIRKAQGYGHDVDPYPYLFSQ